MTHMNVIEIVGSPGLIFHHSESQWLLYNSRNVELKTKGQCCVGRGTEMCSFFLLEGGTLWGPYPQYSENFTFPAWCVGGLTSQHEDEEAKDKNQCGKHSQGPGFCREEVWPQPRKPAWKINSSAFHGPEHIMSSHIKRYPRGVNPGASTLFSCMVSPLLKKKNPRSYGAG